MLPLEERSLDIAGSAILWRSSLTQQMTQFTTSVWHLRKLSVKRKQGMVRIYSEDLMIKTDMLMERYICL